MADTHQSECRLRDGSLGEQIVQCIAAVMVHVDEQGRVAKWNGAAEEALGMAEHTALGRPFPECGVSWDAATLRAQIDSYLDEGRPGRLTEITVTHDCGTKRVVGFEIHPAPVADDGGRAYLLLGRDLTDRNQLEQQDAQSQKLEALGQLASGIAHEINTPTQYVGDNIRFFGEALDGLQRLLAAYARLLDEASAHPALAGSIESVRQTIEAIDLAYLTEELPKAIEQSKDGISQVTRIVRAMKEFAHPDETQMTPTDLNHAIQSTVTVTRNEWKYVSTMELDLDPYLPKVMCHGGELNQVLLNLIVNARDAIEEAGRGMGVIRISSKAEDEHVELRVSDDGAGMPPEIVSKVFDPFFTTKPVGKGSGQGLSLAYYVITEKHGGTIHVESQAGAGTTFVIRLPLEAEPAVASEGIDG